MTELYWKPAHELAAMIRKRKIKPSELMELTIRRIEQTNPKLNAFCALRADAAMAEARALDEKIARQRNEEVGTLAGVTRNPWNLERTPGGSSGGSSAAIAGGVVPLATGSDGGGSVRIPACYTGCYGLKPSLGRIPHGPTLGMQQWNDTSVHGAITRTVRDAAIFMDAVVGYHPADPDSIPHPGISCNAILERLPKKLRIAFHPDFGQLVQRDVMREIEKAAAVFKDLGHDLTTIDDPVPDTGRVWMQVGATQGYAMLHEWLDKDRENFGRAFATGTEGATRVMWKHYGAAYRRRREFNDWCQHVFERLDRKSTRLNSSHADISY